MVDGGEANTFRRLLAERAAADPAYLAWVVQMHAAAEGRAITDVLTQLGVAENYATDFLVSLRPAGERFGEMLHAICARFGAHESTLLAVLREVEVLEAFRVGTRSAAEAGASDAGLLIAARMREDGVRPSTEAPRDDDRADDEEEDDAR